MMETIHTRIWEEESEPDNAFAALSCHCHGYDVYGDLLVYAGWIEHLFLIGLPPSNFALVARSLGAEAHTIRLPEELIKLDITAMCAGKCPTLLNVLIDLMRSPMKVRTRVLADTI